MRGKLPLSLMILTLGVNLGLADRATYDPTKTQMALPLPAPPTIDGLIDTAAEWQWAQGVGPSWIVRPDAALEDGVRGGAVANGGVSESNEDLSFDIYAGYDADNLYIAVRVRDSVLVNDSAEADSVNGSTWLDDSVEVFIDGDNSNFATRDTTGTNPEVVATGGQYVITANNAYREAEAGNPGYGEAQAWFAKTIARDDGTGYDAEFRISLKTIGSPKIGDIIGFTVAVNDDDVGGDAQRQLIWVGATHVEEGYGNLLIGTRAYEAPKTKAPTVDGKINAAEYAGAREIEIDTHTAMFEIGAGDDTFEATDVGFSAWAVHDADAIYVAVDVIDDNVVTDTAEAGSEDGSTWEDDSVEIFFDADLDREFGHSATLQFEGQYVFTPNGAWRDNEALNPTFGADTDWFAATSTTATGYQIEFKVKKSALANPADGATLGFHICQNEDDGTGRSAQVGWSGRAHNEFTYGTLKLLASGPSGPTPVAESSGSISAPAVVDFGALSGSASYEFVFTAVKGGASTAIAGDNAWAIKLDQWDQQGIFGTTQFGVADNVFAAVAGQSVASVFGRRVHVVVVSDTAANETRLYIDGVRVGTWAGNLLLSGNVKVMGARLTQETDHMGAGSVMDRWASYQGALTDADVVKLAAAWPSAGTINIARSTTGVTITFKGTLQQADQVTGPFTDMAGVTSPADLPNAGSLKFYRSRQ